MSGLPGVSSHTHACFSAGRGAPTLRLFRTLQGELSDSLVAPSAQLSFSEVRYHVSIYFAPYKFYLSCRLFL